MLGYEREDLVGKTIFDIIPAEDAPRLKAVMAELLVPGRVDRTEWTQIRKDGTFVPVEVSSNILPDGRWRAFVRDITERKRLEQELRLSEAKASGIVSISADAIISIDDDQRITLFNEGAEKIFGYSKAEAVGASLDILIPERFRAITENTLLDSQRVRRQLAEWVNERPRSSACAKTARNSPLMPPFRSSMSVASGS
jgi:PAS domain-containing protein